jgi:SAM-dependent methyltransferase
MKHEASLNHDFILEQLRDVDPSARGRVLDFGCGTGAFVKRATDAGYDTWGGDTFRGIWADWHASMPPDISGKVANIVDGRLPFPDAHFDVVVTNQVFEHIDAQRLEGVVREMSRVMKPGAVLFALFPVYETWFEGHLGLYFPHYGAGWPRLQRWYLETSHKLGFGYHRGTIATLAWAQAQQTAMDKEIFFHRIEVVKRLLADVFGAPPQSLALAYMQHRVRSHPRLKACEQLSKQWPITAALRWICSKRAGEVLRIKVRRPYLSDDPPRRAAQQNVAKITD